MEGSGTFREFARAGCERLGIEADEAELAVAEVADSLYGPHTDALMSADLDGVEPEAAVDPSVPPA